jgi:hypothetical protein
VVLSVPCEHRGDRRASCTTLQGKPRVRAPLTQDRSRAAKNRKAD